MKQEHMNGIITTPNYFNQTEYGNKCQLQMTIKSYGTSIRTAEGTKENRTLHPVMTTRNENRIITDFAYACICSIATSAVIGTIDAFIAHSDNATVSAYNALEQLRKQALAYSHMDDVNTELFEQYVALDTQESKEFEQAHMMERKMHRYKMKTIDGKRVRVEVIPYETFETTKYGKELMKLYIADGSDAEDLYQIAKLALIECVVYGIARDIHTLRECRKYACSAIGREIRKGRKGMTYNVPLTIENNDGENEQIDIADMHYYVETIHAQDAFTTLEKQIRAQLDKRVDGKFVSDVLWQHCYFGLTIENVAKNTKKDLKAVYRAQKYIHNSIIAIYGSLNNFIESWM